MNSSIKPWIYCDDVGFFICPTVPDLAVSECGLIYDVKNRKISESSYPNRENPLAKRTYLSVYGHSVHRLVAETFCEKLKDVPLEEQIVNHKDGNIYNNNSKNLEWVTFSGNSIHAYTHGLRSDNIPLLCKDVETGLVLNFYSYWDCARYFEINAGTVSNFLNRKKRNKLFLGKYVLIRSTEDWPEVDYEELKYDIKNGVLVDDSDGGAVIYTTLSEVATHCDVSLALVSKRFTEIKEKRLMEFKIGRYSIVPLKFTDKWIEHKKEVVKRKRPDNFTRKPVPVKVSNLENGVTEVYQSLESFCNKYGWKKNSVQKHILNNGGKWHGLFNIEYLTLAR